MAQTTVYYNGVRDLRFSVKDKTGATKYVTLSGSGAGLKGPDAKPLPGAGAYGITIVDADLFAEVKKCYGGMKVFKDGYIRDGASEKQKAAAKEQVSSLDNGQGPSKGRAKG